MDINESVNRCLEGAYDLHVHSSPSLAPRIVNDFELLEDADAAGMAGVLIKNHDEPTSSRALLSMLAVKPKRTQCYGGFVMNYPAGGINSCAVETAAKTGAKEIWFPTCDAENDLKFNHSRHPSGRPGITVLDNQGNLLPEIYEVFDIAKQYGLAVGTGHLSLAEIEQVCSEGLRCGVRMVFTHPEWRSVAAPLELQIRLSKLGVLLEKAWVPVALGDTSKEELIHSIRVLEPEHIYLVTDHGADYLKKPIDAMRDFIGALLENGFDESELNIMLRENPQRVLGL